MTATTLFWKSSRSYLQFLIGMAEKGQTQANCNLENTNQIGNKVGERREVEKRNSIGDAKDFQIAIDRHEGDLKISIEVGDKAGEGKAYCNLGNAYNSLGDFQKALEYHERHLKISKEVGDMAGEGMAYGNLGNAYNSLGDFQKAIEYHERHLKISIEVGDRAGKGRAYCNIGNAYNRLGDYQKAVHYYKNSVIVFDHIRGNLISNDEWKISLGSWYDDIYL